MLSKCCCCLRLRTGSLVLAISGIIQGLGLIALYNLYWAGFVQGILVLVAHQFLLFGVLKHNEIAIQICLLLETLIIFTGILFGVLAIVGIGPFVPQLFDNCEGKYFNAMG